MAEDRQILFLLFLFYVFPITLGFLIVYGVSLYIGSVQNGNATIIIGAFLTAASILFGFTTSSLIRFSDKTVDLKQKTSDVAKELCEVYRIVEVNEKLSSKILSYKTKVHNYGRKSAFSETGKALITIKSSPTKPHFWVFWHVN